MKNSAAIPRYKQPCHFQARVQIQQRLANFIYASRQHH